MTATRAAARVWQGKRSKRGRGHGAQFSHTTTTNSIKILLKLNKYFIILHILLFTGAASLRGWWVRLRLSLQGHTRPSAEATPPLDVGASILWPIHSLLLVPHDAPVHADFLAEPPGDFLADLL